MPDHVPAVSGSGYPVVRRRIAIEVLGSGRRCRTRRRPFPHARGCDANRIHLLLSYPIQDQRQPAVRNGYDVPGGQRLEVFFPHGPVVRPQFKRGHCSVSVEGKSLEIYRGSHRRKLFTPVAEGSPLLGAGNQCADDSIIMPTGQRHYAAIVGLGYEPQAPVLLGVFDPAPVLSAGDHGVLHQETRQRALAPDPRRGAMHSGQVQVMKYRHRRTWPHVRARKSPLVDMNLCNAQRRILLFHHLADAFDLLMASGRLESHPLRAVLHGWEVKRQDVEFLAFLLAVVQKRLKSLPPVRVFTA